MEKKSIVQMAKTTNLGQGKQEPKHLTLHWTSQGQSRGLNGVGVVLFVGLAKCQWRFLLNEKKKKIVVWFCCKVGQMLVEVFVKWKKVVVWFCHRVGWMLVKVFVKWEKKRLLQYGAWK
jgi:hypothetical protein